MKLKVLTAVLTTCAAVLVTPAPAFADKPSAEEMGRPEKPAETAADHLAAAKWYEQKAAEWKQEAEAHRAMAAAYKKERPEDAAVMEKHCNKIMKDAQALAKDAEDTAQYHQMRAKEMPKK
jgi:hypothetical protein